MKILDQIHPQFIVDDAGHKVSVILDVKEFKSLIEQIEDILDAAEAQKVLDEDTGSRPLEEIEKELFGDDE